MQFLVVFSAVVAVALARPGFVAPIQHQYHAQDELGQYTYGYSGGPSAKVETKTADGVTRGAYSYIDSNGLVQNVNYVADSVNGFRVAATNLPVAPAAPAVVTPVAAVAAPIAAVAPAVVAAHPVETPEVAVARAEHLAVKAAADAQAYSAAVATPAVAIAAPAPVVDTPEVAIEKARHLATLSHARATVVDDSLVTDDGSYKVSPLEDDGEYRGEAAQVAVVHSAVGPVAAVVTDDDSHLHDDGSYKINPLEDDGSYKGEIAVVGSNIIHSLAPYSRLATASYVSHPLAYAAPATARYAVATPAVHAVRYNTVAHAVVPATHSQYHAQDELGQYQYGYAAPLSTKHEARSADGVTRGGYSYIDANGIVQTVNYVSDSVNGFRVAATNLPVAPQ